MAGAMAESDLLSFSQLATTPFCLLIYDGILQCIQYPPIEIQRFDTRNDRNDHHFWVSIRQIFPLGGGTHQLPRWNPSAQASQPRSFRGSNARAPPGLGTEGWGLKI